MGKITKRQREEVEAEGAQEMVKPYRNYVSDTDALTSILYDIDLLPEQIILRVNAIRMIAFCLIFKQLTPDGVAALFEDEP